MRLSIFAFLLASSLVLLGANKGPVKYDPNTLEMSPTGVWVDLDASNITSGTISLDRLPGDLSSTASNTYVLKGDGSATNTTFYPAAGGSVAATFIGDAIASGSFSNHQIFLPNQTLFSNSIVFGDGGRNFSTDPPYPNDPLSFELSGVYAGQQNTYLGIGAGLATTTGNGNTYLGHKAGNATTIGDQNTYVGWQAGQYNASNYHNTFVGAGSGQEMRYGNYNTFLGCDSGLTALGGDGNIFIGSSTGGTNIGSYNVAIGFMSAIGGYMSSNSVYVGASAGKRVKTGAGNVAIGNLSMGSAESTGSGNTAIGYNSLPKNVGGYENAVFGSTSLGANVEGYQNTSIGYQSFLYPTNLHNCVGLGYRAGLALHSGHHSTFLGDQSDVIPAAATNLLNSTAVGANAVITTNNQVVIGNASVTRTLLRSGVGINETNPLASLHVNGSAIVTNNLVATNISQMAPAWDDVRIPMQSLSSPSSSPGKEAFIGGIYTYAFDKDADEQLMFECQIPHGIHTNAAYGISLHIHFSGITAPTETSNVVWGIEYAMGKVGAAFPLATTTIYATNGLSLATNHVIAKFAHITTGFTESTIIVGRLFRDADNPADTYGGDAYGLSLDAHYPRRSFGSVAELGDY